MNGFSRHFGSFWCRDARWTFACYELLVDGSEAMICLLVMVPLLVLAGLVPVSGWSGASSWFCTSGWFGASGWFGTSGWSSASGEFGTNGWSGARGWFWATGTTMQQRGTGPGPFSTGEALNNAPYSQNQTRSPCM